MFQIERVLNSDIHGNGTTGGHMGEKRTQASIAERFYWRTITEDVKEFVSVHCYVTLINVTALKFQN